MTWEEADEKNERLAATIAKVRGAPMPDAVEQASGAGPTFIKDDKGKPRADLLPPRAVMAVVDVLTFGARKYAPGNWAKCDDLGRYTAAALRHVFAYMRGERTDPETGLHHLAHAATCLLFIVDIELGRGEP